MKTVSVLGSTGSVGVSTLEVIHKNKDSFSVQALTAHKNVGLLAQQAMAFRAKRAVIGDEQLYAELKDRLAGTGIECASGEQAITEAAAMPADITMAAIMGMAGLRPILAAIQQGKNVAIANKEPLVAAGRLVMEAAQKYGAKILPVDSEHNAIFQVFENDNKDKIKRIILTASGGPFREWTLEQMKGATPAQALAHPNWSMGRKISIDSATMMNKALEVIEAHHLFAMPASQIDVLVHPQSIIHSMVEYVDGSILAQMGASDMRVPISYALSWPTRVDSGAKSLDLLTLGGLTFEKTDARRFPAIKLAYDCLSSGVEACVAFNAANEVAVESFLKGDIGFMDIYGAVEHMVRQVKDTIPYELDAILAYDSSVRVATHHHLQKTNI